MLNRAAPSESAGLAFCDMELQILQYLFPEAMNAKTKPSIAECLNTIARLGGYLARRGDSPPGNMVLWRGFMRLTDIHLGFTIGKMWVIERITGHIRNM